MKARFTFLLVFVCFVGVSQVHQGMSLERLDRLKQYVDHNLQTSELPGAAVLVTRNGEKVYEYVNGFSDLEANTMMTADSRFYIQSMTKPIITAAFMMLYEEGYFLLTDPVSKYIPAFADLKVAKDITKGKNSETEELEREITIWHLLSHTAGLSHGLGSSELDKDYARTMYYQPHKTIQSRVNAMLELPLMSQPGEKWYYSAAPDVLSVLIEQFSGMPTDEFLKTRLFEPLQMKSTGYNIPEDDLYKRVAVYTKNSEGKLIKPAFQAPATGVTVWSGVNALYSTPSDYAKFCQMLLDGGRANGKQLLGRKTIELMSTNHTGDLYDSDGEGFGLGFAVVESIGESHLLGSEGTFYWSGANNTHFFIDPKEQIVAIFMTQLAPYDGRFHRELRRYVLQAVVD